jgi:hypothetical protein
MMGRARVATVLGEAQEGGGGSLADPDVVGMTGDAVRGNPVRVVGRRDRRRNRAAPSRTRSAMRDSGVTTFATSGWSSNGTSGTPPSG